MADPKKNPLIGAFRAPVPPPLSAEGQGEGPAEPAPPGKDGKPVAAPKAPAAGKPAEAQGKGPAEQPKDGKDGKPAAAPKPPAAGKPAEAQDKDTAEQPKDRKDGKPAADPKPPAAGKPAEGQSKGPAEQPKDGKDSKPAADLKALTEPLGADNQDVGLELLDRLAPNAHEVDLSEVRPLPGTYVKDKPRENYAGLFHDMCKSGMTPIILRKGEKGELQLVDGFHRCKALEQNNALKVQAYIYEMPLGEAIRYRKEHRNKPDLPIPGKLISPASAEPPKEAEPPAGADTPAKDEEIPEDFTLPITKEGQSEIITTLKVSEIHPFEGHPFNVKDDKDMWDLVDSVKKFGVLEPVVVIPRTAGGYEMVSGHRRRRACELAGIATMPVIVRQLDRDEAVISMVDANLKRKNISPMEKARAYAMKLEAMKRKAGRRTKEETAALEASGEKPMRADEELAQQTGESRSNIQKLVRLTNLTPELQQMVEEKKLPIQTASDLSYLKEEEQKAVADAINKEDKVPSSAQAKELKQASQAKMLTTEKIEKAVAPTKREETPPLKVTLGEEDLRPYFPDKRTTIPDVKQGIFEALALRKKAMERQQNKAQMGKAAAKKPPAPAR